MYRVVLISLLVSGCTAKPSVQEPVQNVQYSETDHPVEFGEASTGVSNLGQDDSDLVLSVADGRDFTEEKEVAGGRAADYDYYGDDEEDMSEAKFLSLTHDLGDFPSLDFSMPLSSLSSKTSAVISLNESVTSTLSTIGNLGLLLGGIYLIGNSISTNKAAKASSRSDQRSLNTPKNSWRKYLTKQPPKFQNVMEKSSLTQFNRKMGLTYGKPKPGRRGPAEKKPFFNKPAKKAPRPAKSKFVRKSSDPRIDNNQERQTSAGQIRPGQGQNDRQGARPVFNPQFRPRVPTIPTLRLRMPTVTLPSLRLNRPNLSNLRQNLRNMVPSLRPLNLPSLSAQRPQAPLTLRRPLPQQPGRRPPAAPASARPAAPPAAVSTSIRPVPLVSTSAASPVSPAAPSTSIRPEPVFEDSTFRNQASPLLPEPIEFNSIFNSNADPFAEFRDEDFGDSASFRQLLDSQFGDFQFNKIKRKDG
jgi:hypothetical protein